VRRNKLPWPKGERKSPSKRKRRTSKATFCAHIPMFSFYLNEPRINNDYLWFSTILYSKQRYLFSSVYQRWRISHCKESIEIYVRYLVVFFFFLLLLFPTKTIIIIVMYGSDAIGNGTWDWEKRSSVYGTWIRKSFFPLDSKQNFCTSSNFVRI